MALDELTLACRLSGLSLGHLWLRYLGVGGNRSPAELASRIAGAPWPEPEDRMLAIVVDEALRENGLPRLFEPAVPRVLLPDLGGPDDEQDLGRCAAAVLEARAHATRLTALFEECGRTRAHARGVRAHAQSVRRDGRASGRRVGG